VRGLYRLTWSRGRDHVAAIELYRRANRSACSKLAKKRRHNHPRNRSEAPAQLAVRGACCISQPSKEKRLQVFVRDNNVDQALRVLKKKMQREGVFREMKQRRSYEKPSERKTREKSEAIRRARKLARKQAIREGLLPAPPKKKLPVRKPPLPEFTSKVRTE
jgi:small subunit ribosomal protein S21